MRILSIFVAVILGSVEMMSVVDMELENQKVKRSEACYDKLGCFSTDPPFTGPWRLLSVVPRSPDQIRTTFLLYTREEKRTPKELDARYPENATSIWTNFKVRPTKILVHGFLEKSTGASWREILKDELLKYGDYNVVIVDWTRGNSFPYTQATANTRVVGAQIGEMINSLIKSINITAQDFHLIGVSLGAHICGYAGERVPGVGRISGLDPAGPYFDNTDRAVRLDETDAKFVDVIHTDAKSLLELGFGTSTQGGHLDFYPNLGHDQPGCNRSPIVKLIDSGLYVGMFEIFMCNHIRSIRYYTESVNSPCPFMAFPCASEADFDNHLCYSCAEEGCAYMGFHADTNIPPNGQRRKYFPTTGNKEPFCRYNFIVTIKLTNGQGEEEKGSIDIVINGDMFTSKVSLSKDSTYKPGQSYRFYVTLPNDLGNITSVALSWERTWSISNFFIWNLLKNRTYTLYLDEVDVYRQEAGVDVNFCSGSRAVKSGSSLTLSTKC